MSPTARNFALQALGVLENMERLENKSNGRERHT